MPDPADADADAARRNLDAGQTWIANADTKIGLATAALALLTSAFASRVGVITDAFATEPVIGWVLVTGAAVVLVLLGAAGRHLLRGLLPETVSKRDNRFAWPSVKVLTDEQIAVSCSPEELRVQAWEQARFLAGIAGRKYASLAAGAKILAVAFIALAAWILAGLALTPLMTTGDSKAPSALAEVSQSHGDTADLVPEVEP